MAIVFNNLVMFSSGFVLLEVNNIRFLLTKIMICLAIILFIAKFEYVTVFDLFFINVVKRTK